MKYFFIVLLVLQAVCQAPPPEAQPEIQQVRAERRPLTRVPVKLEVPADYEKGVGDDGKRFDHRPRVVVVDEKAGKYEFRWIGMDGKEKIIKHQRLGAIDVLVSARVEKKDNGIYLYIYTIQNLPSSANRLSGFTVQNFANETKPIRFDPENMHTGLMSDLIPGFREGKWWHYSLLSTYKPTINPGDSIEFKLESKAPPGFVGCKADGGEFGSEGVGEDMPPELERLSLGTKDWPYGYTIGPIDKLSQMSKAERSKYVLDNLQKFVEAGWMAGDTPKIYEAILKRNDLAGALEQARKDLEKEFITSEVFHIIEGLNS